MTTYRSDHPALKGLDLTEDELKRAKRAMHNHLMNGQGMACYCYQELMRVYKEKSK